MDGKIPEEELPLSLACGNPISIQVQVLASACELTLADAQFDALHCSKSIFFIHFPAICDIVLQINVQPDVDHEEEDDQLSVHQQNSVCLLGAASSNPIPRVSLGPKIIGPQADSLYFNDLPPSICSNVSM